MNLKPAVWWIWPLLTAVVLALQLGYPDTGTGIMHDTYSPTAEGQRAFYRLVEEHAYWTDRNLLSLETVLRQDATGQTLCILGPERWPTAKEWDAILYWVADGGSLLFAFRGFQEESIPRLDIRYSPRSGSDPPDDSLPPVTQLTDSANIAWWTDGQLIAPSREVLVRYDDTIQAVRGTYGDGQFVISATSLVFSNQLLTYGDNPVLAIRLMEAAGEIDSVTFDESLNSTGTAKAVGLLLDREFRPLTLQWVLITVLYGWWNFRRYGPLLQSAVGRRQNIVDHTDALGIAHWKTRDGRALLQASWQQFQREWQLQRPERRHDPRWNAVASRLGHPPGTVETWFQEIERRLEHPRLPRRQAATWIRRLAQVREHAHG